MVVQLLILFVSCFIVTVRTEDNNYGNCSKWRNHPNYRLLPSEDVCGRVKINQELGSRILNGKAAEHGSLPWMAYIAIKHGRLYWVCGGSVINENYILTAAHCFRNITEKLQIKVILGLHNSDVLDDGVAETYRGSKHIIMPTFDNVTWKDDIALIRLATKINLKSDYINTICLPNTCELAMKTYIGEWVTAAGWGKISYGKTTKTLQRVKIEVQECDESVLHITDAGIVKDKTHLCAGTGNQMVCRGDSGGPAMYKRNDRMIQVGISSMALDTDCSVVVRNDFSSTFTKVAPLMEWILGAIKP